MEGVSLTVDDELNRWQKYAYGQPISRQNRVNNPYTHRVRLFRL